MDTLRRDNQSVARRGFLTSLAGALWHRPVWAVICFAALSSLALGCAAIETRSSKAPDTDLSQYHTFGFAQSSPPSDARFLTPTNEARVKAAIQSELSQRGFRPEPPGELQFCFYLLTTTRTYDRANPPLDSGSLGSNLRTHYGLLYDTTWGTQSTITYPEGTLVVQALDVKQNRKVWEGFATSALHAGLPPEKLEQRIHEAVAGMFKHFPNSNAKPRG